MDSQQKHHEEEMEKDEKQKLCLLRGNLKDLSFEDLDDSTLIRFLLARDLNVEKATEMYTKYTTWRSTFVPNGFISASQVQSQIAQNKMFIQGKDKQDRPIAVVLGSRHLAAKNGVEEFKRYLVFALDKLCSRVPEGEGKFTIIGDLEGFSYGNSDVRGYLAAVSILQDFYPERLGRVYIVHAPYIFMTLWKIICPFIDKNTKKKVFVENIKSLLEDIDETQLPQIYGGEMKLVPAHNC